jgi:hypothetical protein
VASRRNISEYDVQAAVVAQVRARGVPGLVFWHTPNGMFAGNGARTVARMKKIGMRPGVADLIFLHLRQTFLLELKATARSRVEPEQAAFLSAAAFTGAHVSIATGLDAAIQQLERWGLLRGQMQ